MSLATSTAITTKASITIVSAMSIHTIYFNLYLKKSRGCLLSFLTAKDVSPLYQSHS